MNAHTNWLNFHRIIGEVWTFTSHTAQFWDKHSTATNKRVVMNSGQLAKNAINLRAVCFIVESSMAVMKTHAYCIMFCNFVATQN